MGLGTAATRVSEVRNGVNTKFDRIGCAHSLFTAPQYNQACRFTDEVRSPMFSPKAIQEQCNYEIMNESEHT